MFLLIIAHVHRFKIDSQLFGWSYLLVAHLHFVNLGADGLVARNAELTTSELHRGQINALAPQIVVDY
jgi:hypothetical protein